MYTEEICPTPFEIFVVEVCMKDKWYKIGASFFPEEAYSFIAPAPTKDKPRIRVRKYVPAISAETLATKEPNEENEDSIC